MRMKVTVEMPMNMRTDRHYKRVDGYEDEHKDEHADENEDGFGSRNGNDSSSKYCIPRVN